MAETSEYVSGLGEGRRPSPGEPRIIPLAVDTSVPGAPRGLTPAARDTKVLILARALEQAAATATMVRRLREELGLPDLPDPVNVLRWIQWEGGVGRRCPACQKSEADGHALACDILILLTAGGVTCR